VKSLASRIVITLVLLSLAAIAFTEARWLRHAADTHERLATLRDEGVDGDSTRRLLPVAIVGSDGEDTVTAKAEYWRGRYDALRPLPAETDRDPNPEVLLLAANAAYRSAERERLPRQAQLEELDAVLQAYASALKASRFVPDAAYNYEFVARLRETLGRSRSSAAAPSSAPKSAAARSSDLPLGPTIHGQPGGPPPGTKGEQFEILTPMEFGDRESQPEPTTGVRPLRKG
jgi:hypothetical protein